MTLESSIVKEITKGLALRGAWWFKVHGNPMQVSGIPDLLVCYRGCFVAVEVKVPGEKASKIQRYTLRQIKRAGGERCVATNWERVEAILDAIDERLDNGVTN